MCDRNFAALPCYRSLHHNKPIRSISERNSVQLVVRQSTAPSCRLDCWLYLLERIHYTTNGVNRVNDCNGQAFIAQANFAPFRQAVVHGY